MSQPELLLLTKAIKLQSQVYGSKQDPQCLRLDLTNRNNNSTQFQKDSEIEAEDAPNWMHPNKI